jgi:NAD(P)H-nitrite reductase large subunit
MAKPGLGDGVAIRRGDLVSTHKYRSYSTFTEVISQISTVRGCPICNILINYFIISTSYFSEEQFMTYPELRHEAIKSHSDLLLFR